MTSARIRGALASSDATGHPGLSFCSAEMPPAGRPATSTWEPIVSSVSYSVGEPLLSCSTRHRLPPQRGIEWVFGRFERKTTGGIRGWGAAVQIQLKFRLALAGLALAAAVAGPSAASAQTKPICRTHANLVRLAKPLARLSRKLESREAITIVAIGSSSTAGAGASSRAANYPSRLQAELRRRFPDQPITVINRGIGGQVIDDMLKRFDRAVLAAKPDLVIWQLGTNSVLRNLPIAGQAAAIRAGLAKIRATGADVVLIDPQYAPRVIAKDAVEPMLMLIATTAKQEDVDLFHRFAVMKRWHEKEDLTFDMFVSRDGVHMNDWSYACMAKELASTIAEAATRPVISAVAAPIFEGPY